MSKFLRQGFTLTEIIVTIAVISALVLLIAGISPAVIRSISKAQCLSNMRSLHVALNSYINEKGYWPPQPDGLESDTVRYDTYWMNAMYPYTQSNKIWSCPILVKGKLKNASGDPIKVHYIPTKFDSNRQTPFRWPKQPWLIEIANAHGQGPLILFPDGSIKSLGDILKKN